MLLVSNNYIWNKIKYNFILTGLLGAFFRLKCPACSLSSGLRMRYSSCDASSPEPLLQGGRCFSPTVTYWSALAWEKAEKIFCANAAKSSTRKAVGHSLLFLPHSSKLIKTCATLSAREASDKWKGARWKCCFSLLYHPGLLYVLTPTKKPVVWSR